jgi:hypothetical protein
MNEKNRLGKGVRAAKVCAYVMIVLTGVKMGVGLFSGSIALLADAVHCFRYFHISRGVVRHETLLVGVDWSMP